MNMKKPIVFYKMEASGNDFVVIDNRKKTVRDVIKFTREICDRHKSAGADGVLFIETSRRADFKMRIVNADGSEAEMCGNGSRCVALYAHKVMKLPAKFLMETLAGLIGADVGKQKIRVRLSDPKDFKPRAVLKADGEPLSLRSGAAESPAVPGGVAVGDGTDWQYYFVNTGVPHAVIFVEDIANFPVQTIGEKIRYHENFKPAGTNVNFVQITDKDAISVRTYERGVGETQACGTGVTASALISAVSGRTRPPVKVKTLGGEILAVDFKLDSSGVRDVYLEGKANFIYKGTLSHD